MNAVSCTTRQSLASGQLSKVQAPVSTFSPFCSPLQQFAGYNKMQIRLLFLPVVLVLLVNAVLLYNVSFFPAWAVLHKERKPHGS
jgi:hypothetical protein